MKTNNIYEQCQNCSNLKAQNLTYVYCKDKVFSIKELKKENTYCAEQKQIFKNDYLNLQNLAETENSKKEYFQQEQIYYKKFRKLVRWIIFFFIIFVAILVLILTK